MIFVVGEILIDLFENYQRIGGAPFNFAFHLKQLGFPVRFLSRIGDDGHGREIRGFLEKHGFDPDDIQVDPHHPTGTVNVTTDPNGIPAFDIRTDVAYDFLDLEAVPLGADGTPAAMIYMGSLVQRTPSGFGQVSRFLSKKAPSTKVFFDVNLRSPHINPKALSASLEYSNIVKLNDEELTFFQRLLDGPEAASDFISWMIRQFSLEWVIVTCGEEGSAVHNGINTTTLPPVKNSKITDTVGAGDAYAAVMAAGYLKRLSMHPIADAAARFAAKICTIPGAIPEDMGFYQKVINQIGGANHVS